MYNNKKTAAKNPQTLPKPPPLPKNPKQYPKLTKLTNNLLIKIT